MLGMPFNQLLIQLLKVVTHRKTSKILVKLGALTDAMVTSWIVVVDTSLFKSLAITADQALFIENRPLNLAQRVSCLFCTICQFPQIFNLGFRILKQKIIQVPLVR